MVIPDSTESCEGVTCSVKWCKGDQKCGNNAPFQCVEGSSRFGCGSDKFSWTLKTSDATCSECCDVTMCWQTWYQAVCFLAIFSDTVGDYMLNYEYILEYNELSTTRTVSNTLKSN
jgi:hypothetical protein